MHIVDAIRSFAMLRMTIFDRVFGMTNTKQKNTPAFHKEGVSLL